MFLSSSILLPSSFLADSLPNMNPYQKETAEKTPAADMACASVRVFAILVFQPVRPFQSCCIKMPTEGQLVSPSPNISNLY